MRVTPKTEKEIVESRLLPKGWYPFTIGEATEALSKAAKDRGETEPNMIALNVQVYKDNGFVYVKDWLMDSEFGAYKLRHCAESCGLLDAYNAGSLTADSLIGKEGYVKVGIQKRKNDFPDQNRIEDYSAEPPKPRGAAVDVPLNEAVGDDIPF